MKASITYITIEMNTNKKGTIIRKGQFKFMNQSFSNFLYRREKVSFHIYFKIKTYVNLEFLHILCLKNS